MSTATESAQAIVQQFHEAWTSGRVDEAMLVVADDVAYHVPGQELAGKAQVGAFLAGFAPSLTGVREIGRIADGQHVAQFYYPQTQATASAPAAEYFTVTDGLITDIVVIFDRMSFGPPAAQ